MPVTTPCSVSHGTMRYEDLIPSFMSELESLNSANPKPAITQLLADIAIRQSHEDYYDSEQASWDYDELFDWLNTFAGDGLYFGSHPGDGSDYGFWAIELA